MSKINFSRHFMQDRADRYIFIAQTVGFGEVVHTHQVHTTKGSGYVEITTSGLVIVRGDDETVITMYLASFAEIKRYCIIRLMVIKYDAAEVKYVKHLLCSRRF